jgi:replicative DNA helicase
MLEGLFPPQNIEAEELILGGILLDPEAIARTIDLLKPQMFYIEAHQEIFKAALVLHSQSLPVDMMSITTWLRDRGLLDRVGGQSKIVQLCDRTVSAVNIDYYAQLVAEKYKRRQLIAAAQEVMELAYNTSVDIAEAIERSENAIFTATNSSKDKGLVSAEGVLAGKFLELEERNSSLLVQKQSPGIETGFYDLDRQIGNLRSKNLSIICGRPNMGKSALAFSAIANVAAKYHRPVAIFSLEMTNDEILERMLSRAAKVSASHLRDGNIQADEWGAIAGAIAQMPSRYIYLNDSPDITSAGIRSECLKLKARQGDLGLIVVDHLHLMTKTGEDGNDSNRATELDSITRGLKSVAKQLDCHVMCLAQLNRGVEGRNNKRPMLSDLRESGSIEANADVVIGLYRDEYYNPESDRGMAEAIVLKHRNGSTGTVKLLFDSQFVEFKNMTA